MIHFNWQQAQQIISVKNNNRDLCFWQILKYVQLNRAQVITD